MAKTAYQLDKLAPRADAGGSGSPFDPLRINLNKALGRFAAVPPYVIADGKAVVLGGGEPVEYNASVMPMRIRRSGDREWFTLPVEPLVSVSARNTIVRRKVAKSQTGGSIKECWCRDDYEVTIRGVVTGADARRYPGQLLGRLMELFEERRSVETEQGMLLALGIHWLAIESVSFPHTKGLNNQSYEIKAYSDDPSELLIKI